MKINPVNLGTRLISYYESDYSDESWCILEVSNIQSLSHLTKKMMKKPPI